MREDTPLGPLRTRVQIDRKAFMEVPHVLHLGLTLTTHLSMVPA